MVYDGLLYNLLIIEIETPCINQEVSMFNRIKSYKWLSLGCSETYQILKIQRLLMQSLFKEHFSSTSLS